jgi:ribosomal 50S subunit-associated protein YjgA (DUF615 family)
MNIKEALRFIIASEPTIELRQNLLAKIALTSPLIEISNAADDLRNEIAREKEVKSLSGNK